MVEAKIEKGKTVAAEPVKAKCPKLKVRERVEAAEAAKLLAELAGGLKSGLISIERGGQRLSLTPPQDVKLRLKVCEGLRSDKLATKGRVKLRLSWG